MKVAELRDSLRRMAPGAHPVQDHEREPGLGTGFSELDELLLGRGLPRGKLTELSGGHSSGKTTLALSFLSQVQDKLVAFVDAQGHFYPPMAAARGVSLSHLLLVRLHHLSDLEMHAARAAEILIRSRHFPLVIVDLPPRHQIAHKRCQRLNSAVKATGASVVVLTHESLQLERAALRLSANTLNKELNVAVQKGGATPHSRVRLPLHPIRIDHAPPQPAPPVATRTLPGTPPRAPHRARGHA